ncbi:Outer membrane protein beta-barrel domain containing protein [Flavobacteriaceae bacterium]
MKAKLFLVTLLVSTMTMVGQTTTTTDSKPETWYFKIGGSYFMEATGTEFPVVNGQLPNSDVYAANGTTLVSRETNTGSFGQGFRTGITAGYRFTTRFGLELGVNYFNSTDKLMVKTVNRLTSAAPSFVSGTAEGQVTALDIAPAAVLFFVQNKKFESYTKVGVILPIHGDLTIETNRTYTSPAGVTTAYAKEEVLPNPTLGFSGALGTTYKLGKNISLFAEIEYRNFTVGGDTKETKEYTENGVDKLNTPTSFRDGTYSSNHTNYVEQLNSSSNHYLFNPNLASPYPTDTTRPNEAMNDISSYISISGVGMTFGLKYSL